MDSGRWLMRRGRGLDAGRGTERIAREIAEVLAEYLERTIGRPRGVLTPDEARSTVAAATQDADLGARCARLVTDCDQAMYSERATGTGSAELVDDARRLFEEIGRRGRA